MKIEHLTNSIVKIGTELSRSTMNTRGLEIYGTFEKIEPAEH